MRIRKAVWTLGLLGFTSLVLVSCALLAEPALSPTVATDAISSAPQPTQVTLSPVLEITMLAATTQPPAPAYMPTSTAIATPSRIPKQARTLTWTPGLDIQPTPWPSRTPTLTPRPTVPPGKAEALVLELFETNAGCDLPCWWGLVPGETKWSTAQNFLATFATRIGQTRTPDGFRYTVYLRVGVQEHPARRLVQDYVAENDVIKSIGVELGATTRKGYSLSQVLSKYGRPSEVRIRTFSSSRDNTLPFYIVLFYQDKGIMVSYLDNAERAGDTIVGCPQNEDYPPLLWLSSPGETTSFLEVAARAPNFGVEESEAYFPLSQVSELDLDSFYQTYVNTGGTSCLTTPAAQWPPPR